MNYEIMFAKKADKDLDKIRTIPSLKKTVAEIIELLRINPFMYPPEYEKLDGDLKGLYSRRLNNQHRLVYEVFKKEKIVKIISMWTHYE